MTVRRSQCPFCLSAIEGSDVVTKCEHCGALHHEDCWKENGGCAVVACAGAPSADTSAARTGPALPPITDHHRNTIEVPGAQPAPDPPRSRGRLVRQMALLVGGLAILAAAGASAAVVLSGGGGLPERPERPSGSATAEPEAEAEADATDEDDAAAPTESGGPPDRAEARREITQLLRGHYERIFAENWDAAWRDWSASKRHTVLSGADDRPNPHLWLSSETGASLASAPPGFSQDFYREALQRADRESFLNLEVRVESIEREQVRGERVWEAEVVVTGPRYHSPSCSYEGTTWAIREDGEWRYDPGYGGVDHRGHISANQQRGFGGPCQLAG